MSGVGRPTKMTKEVIDKLEKVFSLGGSDGEACYYASISRTILYNYQKDHPEFVDRKEQLKERTILKAREEVIAGLSGNPEFALKYLERKRKKEFSTHQNIDHTTDGKPITINTIQYGIGGENSNNTL